MDHSHQMTPPVETLTEGYGLIEGPVWHPDKGLIFSDVQFGGAYAVTPSGTVSTVFEHRKGIGGMALHPGDGVDDGMVMSGRNIAFKPFSDGTATTAILERDEAAGEVGFNDITTDSVGRVYAGSLAASPFESDAGQRAGRLHMIDLDGSTHVVGEDVLLTNGLGFSPDGTVLYHSDSTRRAVMKYAVHGDGTLGPKETAFEVTRGVPDGLVVSEDGAVWVALASRGGAVAVHEPSGELRGLIETPVPMCTSVCFGGDDLRDLYIVSGSEDSGSEKGGGVYVTRTEVPGLPVSPARVPLH